MIETVLGYKSAWRILSLMAEAPRKSLTRRFLKAETLLGNKALDEALHRLRTTGIIIEERNLYRLDLGCPDTEILLELLKRERERLRHLDYRLRIVLAELTRSLLDNSLEEAWLFGSHARGTARSDSDIDVALIYTAEPDETELATITDRVERKFSVKIQLHTFTTEGFAASNLAPQVKQEGLPLLRFPAF